MKILFLAFALILVSNTRAIAATADSLDQYVELIQKDLNHSPFEYGEAHAKQNPHYAGLIAYAWTLGTKIEWADSIAARVLKLPFEADRMKVTLKDQMEGWFDEFTSPNLIILEKDTCLSTLVHELRHAVQLGRHPLTGNRFDRMIQMKKRLTDDFKQRLMKSDLSAADKKRLKNDATRLVESCSEIGAHSSELTLARAFHETEVVKTTLQYMKEYRDEYKAAYHQLKSHAFSQTEKFVEDFCN